MFPEHHMLLEIITHQFMGSIVSSAAKIPIYFASEAVIMSTIKPHVHLIASGILSKMNNLDEEPLLKRVEKKD